MRKEIEQQISLLNKYGFTYAGDRYIKGNHEIWCDELKIISFLDLEEKLKKITSLDKAK